MSSKLKILHPNLLITDPVSFVQKKYKQLKFSQKSLMFFYVLLNLITILGSLSLVVLGTLFLSKLIWTSYATWYYYYSAGFSAFTTLITALFNFFVIKDKLTKTRTNLDLIVAELLLFYNKRSQYHLDNKKQREFLLFTNVIKITNEHFKGGENEKTANDQK